MPDKKLPPELEREFMAILEIVERIKAMNAPDPSKFTFMVSVTLDNTENGATLAALGYGGDGNILQGMLRGHIAQLIEAGVVPTVRMSGVPKGPMPPQAKRGGGPPPVC